LAFKNTVKPVVSVADPGYLSLIPGLDFYPSRVPNPTTATTKEEGGKFVVLPFYSNKFHNCKINLFLNRYRKK
jgi:hypothetical protein